MSARALARRLSPLDAAFLYIETPEAPLHLGGVDVFDGPLSREALVDRIAGRISEIPRYRQRVVPEPFGLGHPSWEDAPDFDVRNHVLETTVRWPGDEAQLKASAARIFEPLLSRERPLWELHLVHGLAGGQTAVVSKIHHAMVDGVSGAALLDVLFDLTPEGQPTRTPAPVLPAGPSGTGGLLLETAWDAAADLLEAGSGVAGQIGQLLRGGGPRLGRALEVAGELGRAAVEPVARLPFNRALTGARRLSWVTLSSAEARRIRAARGGTLNDLVLAVIADAVGRALRDGGEPTAGRRFRMLVPVNVRREDEFGQLGNRVSMVPVEAPFDADPLARLVAVQARTARLKQARIADAVEDLISVAGLIPAPVYAAVLALAARPSVLTLSAPLRSLPPLTANVVCTNVPGPQVPLFSQGHRLVAHYPIVPLAFELGLGFAIFSYDERLFIGLIADGAAIDDLDPLARHVAQAFEDLRTAAGVPTIPPVPTGRPNSSRGTRAHADR